MKVTKLTTLEIFDRVFLSIIYLPIFPIFFFVIGWWGSLPFLHNSSVSIYAFTGLFMGIITDAFFLKKCLNAGYNQKTFILIIVYIFYSTGIFGFFMGVPIFNIIPGIFAGIYVARKAISNNLEEIASKTQIRKTAWFSVLVLLFICICSATIALIDPYTGDNLSGMLKLSFSINKTMIWGVIVIGGLILLIMQYYLTTFIGQLVLTYNRIKLKNTNSY
jgi:hypothetical protein